MRMAKKLPTGTSLPKVLQGKHKDYAPDRWPAARLEGKVENRGLKNVGRQTKKGKRGNR